MFTVILENSFLIFLYTDFVGYFDGNNTLQVTVY